MAQEDGKPEVLGVNTSRQFVSDASLPPAASSRRTKDKNDNGSPSLFHPLG